MASITTASIQALGTQSLQPGLVFGPAAEWCHRELGRNTDAQVPHPDLQNWSLHFMSKMGRPHAVWGEVVWTSGGSSCSSFSYSPSCLPEPIPTQQTHRAPLQLTLAQVPGLSLLLAALDAPA